jgi:hypothetical protein
MKFYIPSDAICISFFFKKKFPFANILTKGTPIVKVKLLICLFTETWVL